MQADRSPSVAERTYLKPFPPYTSPYSTRCSNPLSTACFFVRPQRISSPLFRCRSRDQLIAPPSINVVTAPLFFSPPTDGKAQTLPHPQQPRHSSYSLHHNDQIRLFAVIPRQWFTAAPLSSLCPSRSERLPATVLNTNLPLYLYLRILPKTAKHDTPFCPAEPLDHIIPAFIRSVAAHKARSSPCPHPSSTSTPYLFYFHFYFHSRSSHLFVFSLDSSLPHHPLFHSAATVEIDRHPSSFRPHRPNHFFIQQAPAISVPIHSHCKPQTVKPPLHPFQD